MRLTPWLLLLQRISKVVYHKVLFWDLFFFSLFINDLPLHVKDISVDCDILADDTTLHTSGKDIMQIRSNMQDSLDQVPIGVIIIIWSSIQSRPSP